ncbi:MAG: glycosyltransferase family 2 protein [Desulfomicrobium sp.]|nr:glycosyltransferase family 2 protein [Desulfomicrobium sp.]
MEEKAKKIPYVSIGMPVYNGEKFIKESLSSLLHQSYTNFELIISDNSSTDNTENICKEYAKKDPRIIYIRQTENIGAANNFIFVFNKKNNSKYFMWAACDDSWSENWLEVLITNIKENDCGLFGRYIQGNVQETSCPKSFFKSQFINFFLTKDISGKCYYSYALFKAGLLEKSNMKLMKISVGADQIYLLNLLQFGSLRFVDGCVFKYRVHEESEASRQSKKYGVIRRALLSHYPIDYYVGAIRAVPNLHKISIVCFIPVKYFYEQIPKWIMIINKIFRIFNNAMK